MSKNDGGPAYPEGTFALKDGKPVLVHDVCRTTERGWIYAITYVQTFDDRSWTSGGASFWWDENQLSRITDAEMVLRAKRWQLLRRRSEIEAELRDIAREDGHIAAAQKVLADAMLRERAREQ